MSESPSQLGTSTVADFSPILLSTTGPPSQHLNSVFSTHVQTASQSQYTAMQAMKSSFTVVTSTPSYALLSLSSSLPSSTPSGGSGSLSLIVIVYISGTAGLIILIVFVLFIVFITIIGAYLCRYVLCESHCT